MTIGQRIALKRKERSLSQEALGQEVGVSRQSIYKWESDAAVPEIDKLIALSRLFGVSVGWLLGVEEPLEADGAGETASPSSAPEELTEAQLKMVEQIVERYTAALPTPPSPRRRRWNQFGIAAGVLCLGAVLVSLFSRLDGLDRQYNDLQNGLAQMESSVNSQMGSATGRIEDILKAQSNLTADYSVELVPTASSAKENQAEFSVHAVLKSYTEGTEVKFSVDNDTGAVIYTPGVAAPDGGFTGTLSCQLTDSIAVSAVLINPDGTRSTQLLERFQCPKSRYTAENSFCGSSRTGAGVSPSRNSYFRRGPAALPPRSMRPWATRRSPPSSWGCSSTAAFLPGWSPVTPRRTRPAPMPGTSA